MSDTEDNSFNTAPTDLGPSLDAQQDTMKTPNQVPFTDTIKALNRSAKKAKKRKKDSTNLVTATRTDTHSVHIPKHPVQFMTTTTNQGKMADLIAPLVTSQFSMHSATATKFRKQLSAYFLCIGIANKSCLSMMSSYASWVPPTNFSTQSQTYKLITVPVLMMLAKLASYAVIFNANSLHMTPGATFDELTAQNMMFSKKNEMTGVKTTHQESSKIQAFSLPTFQGDTLNGDAYLESIELSFKSAAMVDFLIDERHCDNHLPRSQHLPHNSENL